MAKKVTINVRTEIGLKEVDSAEEVGVASYPDEKFFVHKSIDIDGWTFTEAKTGLAVVYGIKTKCKCIEEAIYKLDIHDRVKFLKRIDDITSRYGYANKVEV